jgi:hypothetical protein
MHVNTNSDELKNCNFTNLNLIRSLDQQAGHVVCAVKFVGARAGLVLGFLCVVRSHS